MDIPSDVDVLCESKVCGRSVYIVINPVNDQITHLVVAEKDFPFNERLVPVSNIVESSPNRVKLNCSEIDLKNMDAFMETDFINSGSMELNTSFNNMFWLWPYGISDVPIIPLEFKHIPAGEVVVRRGTQVMALDGIIGKVDEFLINPENGDISHLIMREGHLWGAKDVSIPVSEIKKIDNEAIYLRLEKQAISALPSIPVRRKWK